MKKSEREQNPSHLIHNVSGGLLTLCERCCHNTQNFASGMQFHLLL